MPRKKRREIGTFLKMIKYFIQRFTRFLDGSNKCTGKKLLSQWGKVLGYKTKHDIPSNLFIRKGITKR